MKMPRKKSTQGMLLTLEEALKLLPAEPRAKVREATGIYRSRTTAPMKPAHRALVAVLMGETLETR